VKFSHDPKTLAYQLQARPLTRQLDLKALPLSHFGGRAKDFLENQSSMPSPMHEALWFYLGAHAMGAIRKMYRLNEPMSDQHLSLVERHMKRGNEIFLRAVYYTVVICVRETRDLPNQAVKAKIDAAGVGKSWSLIKKVEDDPTTAMQHIMTKMHEGLTLYELSKGMSICFHDPSANWGGSYGGPKWGIIADACVDLCTGKLSPEVFCDVAFALAHNGGPIFNKGMFYKMYDGNLMKILDVQRGGQIPRWVAEEMPHTSPAMKTELKLMQKAGLGDDFDGDVDWEAVQNAGPVGNYKALFKTKEQKLAEAAEKKLKSHVKGTVEYWPNKKLTIIDREGLKVA